MDDQGRQGLWRQIADRAGTADRQGVARAVCAVCVTTLRSVDAAALTLRADPRAQDMLATTHGWAAELEESQYTLGEGPGVDAFTTGGAVLVDDLREDAQRWPGFADVAGALGVRGAFGFPLQVGGIRLGTLDLYRREPGGMPVGEVVDATVLADLATRAVLEQARSGSEESLRSVTSYRDVNIATGMLAAQLRISLNDAFVRLRAHAFAEDRPLREVARDVLARRIRLDQAE